MVKKKLYVAYAAASRSASGMGFGGAFLDVGFSGMTADAIESIQAHIASNNPSLVGPIIILNWAFLDDPVGTSDETREAAGGGNG